MSLLFAPRRGKRMGITQKWFGGRTAFNNEIAAPATMRGAEDEDKMSKCSGATGNKVAGSDFGSLANL